MNQIHQIAVGLMTVLGSLISSAAIAQEPAATDRADNLPPPLQDGAQPGGARSDERVKPLMEGPLHEAFLSPRKDRIPVRSREGAPAAALRAARRRSAQRQRGMDRGLLGVGCGPQGFRLGDGNLASSPAGAILGQRLLEARRPGLVSRGRILERAEDRPARLPQERTAAGPARRRAGRAPRQTTVSISRASTIPMATASSGRRGSGPRYSPVGRGSLRSGCASQTAGSSRKATGTECSRIGEPCSLPRRWIQAPAGQTTWSISPITRSRRRCTAS